MIFTLINYQRKLFEAYEYQIYIASTFFLLHNNNRCTNNLNLVLENSTIYLHVRRIAGAETAARRSLPNKIQSGR